MTAFAFTARAAPRVQVGLGSVVELSSSLWDVAEWDDATSLWAGNDPTWRDVDCDIISAHTEAGRARITDPFMPGRAEVIVDNASGWADPTVAPDIPGVLTMRPGRAIRIGVDHATLGTVWKFRGFVDAIEPVYSPQDWDTVILRCIDALGEAGRAKLSDVDETGADETAAARFARILDVNRWPETQRLIDATSTELYAAVLTGQAIQLLQRSADSTGGWAFGDTEGRVVLRNRDWLFYADDVPVDATIGNVDAGDVCPTGFQRAFDRRSIATQVTIDRAPPSDVEVPIVTTPLVFNDPAGQVLYGVEPFDRLDLWTRDESDAAAIGTRIIETRNAMTSMPRIASVDLDAATGDDALDVMASVSIEAPSRYRCRYQRADGTEVFDDEFFAVGVVHDFSADEWTCSIALDRAGFYEQLAAPPYEWDVATWSHALWN